MPKNLFYKTFVIKKLENQRELTFPTNMTLKDEMIVGIWVRRTGETISSDVVKNGVLTLVSNGLTMFDPLPLDVIASVNELTGSFFPIELNNIDWLKTKVGTLNTVAAQIEIVFKYVK